MSENESVTLMTPDETCAAANSAWATGMAVERLLEISRTYAPFAPSLNEVPAMPLLSPEIMDFLLRVTSCDLSCIT